MQNTGALWIHRLLIIGLLTLLLWKWNCGGTECPPITETVKIDTTHKQVKDSSEWTEMPVPIANAGRIPESIIPKKPDPSYPYQGINVNPPASIPQVIDTQAIVADYLIQHDYSNTYPFENGTIVVENSVGGNKLLKQRVIPTFDVMEITKTITQAERKRGQLYLGIEGVGNQKEPLFGAGASLMWKTKGDKIYEVGALALQNNGVMAKASVKFLISFRK